MRTTITIDDALYKRASEAAGERKPSDVVRIALEALTARESARRLRTLAGRAPDFEIPSRSERLRVAEENRPYPDPGP